MRQCNTCGAELVIGDNWTEKQRAKSIYICRHCETARTRAKIEKNKAKPMPTGMHCRNCGCELTAENWHPTRWARYNKSCNICASATRTIYKTRQDRLIKRQVFALYGEACACCGEHRYEFLTIDPINNNDKQDREQNGHKGGSSFYRKLLREPKRDDLRVLCMNCNWARAQFGYCPHERERNNISADITDLPCSQT